MNVMLSRITWVAADWPVVIFVGSKAANREDYTRVVQNIPALGSVNALRALGDSIPVRRISPPASRPVERSKRGENGAENRVDGST